MTNAAQGRHAGQIMPMTDSRFPIVVRRRTCQHSDEYVGRLPDSQEEMAAYKANCGVDPADIYFQR